jgi:uncharacterized protein with HEPN domain
VSRSDIERVRDILDCIEAIDRAEAAVQRYPGELDVGEIAFDAVQHRIFTIAQTVKSLSLDMREDHPAAPWAEMTRLPDLIGHQFDKLDPQIMTTTIGGPVRQLRTACRSILGESVRAGEDEP